MRVTRLALRDFRGYERLEVALGAGLTVVTGRNGAGKTNLLEGLYFGCTGRSCRTANEREVVRFGAPAARAIVHAEGDDGGHVLEVGYAPGEPKRLRADGAPVERMLAVPARPLVSVFLPDRLELVKGAPQLRRAPLAQVVAAPWPSPSGRPRPSSGGATSTGSWRRCGPRVRAPGAPTAPPWPSATRSSPACAPGWPRA